MKGILIFVGGLILGGLLTFAVGTGVGAGVGIVTGLKAGACLSAEAAKDMGLITSEQVDDVLTAAVKQIASEDIADEAALMGSDAECQKVIADMKAAAKTD